MESFGRYLAQQRELRGMSPEDVARETRLSPTAIDALEGDRFEQLPAPVFVVGYLKAYARCIGLDPDQLVARYHEQTGVAEPEKLPALPQLPPPGPSLPLPAIAAAAVAAGLALWWFLS